MEALVGRAGAKNYQQRAVSKGPAGFFPRGRTAGRMEMDDMPVMLPKVVVRRGVMVAQNMLMGRSLARGLGLVLSTLLLSSVLMVLSLQAAVGFCALA